VLVSALARDQDVTNGLQAGAAGYITKPFNPPELIEAVEALCPSAIHEIGSGV
jgi:DNA-binding response OmpR family regulator